VHELACLVAASALINNLADLIMWSVAGLPVENWLKLAIMDNHFTVIETCFPIVGESA